MKSNSKKAKPLKKFFKKVYKLVDGLIVVPISTVVFKVQKKLGGDNRLEKLLSRPYALLVISGIIAATFALLVNLKATSFVSNDAEFLTNIPVRVIYNSSAYVIEGIPETVDMTLIGKKYELYLARQLGENEVVVDLTDYQASEKAVRVRLTYSKPIDNLSYQISPDYVSVTIKEKVSDNKTVTYDLLNQDELDSKLSVKSVELSKTDVIVRGSQETIDSIATIKALVDLNNEDFTRAGTYTIDNLKLIAYGDDGRIIENVEIVATNINAKVVLDSYSKRVAVKVQTTGELVSGKAISSITINGVNANDFETTIYGDEAALESISYITATIDIDGQGNNGSKTSKVTLPKPAGVRSINDESISIVLNFGEAKQKSIQITGIRTSNVPSGLSANLESANDTTIEVQVIGVESVIAELDKNTSGIYAYVDLTNYSTGTYSVEVKVEGNDSRLQYIVTKNVNVVLSKAN
jgi:YbbR domain-containing protein